ncbi:MAG: DUF4258 domain-containing protein [Acidobacteria bacterium]|nr:DUF4258 domain-containing protein [Acidobacteriota bacterium]
MATVLSKIKRAVRKGDYQIGEHCLYELANDELTISEVISAILDAAEFDKLTDDGSHIRYRIYGSTATNREIVVIVFFSDGTLFLKTVYEPKF